MEDSPLEKRIGYHFRSAGLLQQALTHRSYGFPHNERLEFLGDSVLNCVIAKLLYERFSELPEGDLSRVRANLVNQQSLFEIASPLSLGEHLLLGQGERLSGGSSRPSILADALEALLGAVFVDAGFDTVSKVISTLFGPVVADLDPTAVNKDPKTLLQEFLQGRKLSLPIYSIVDVSGEAHDQLFRVECLVADMNIRTFGEGTSRRSAEQDAAKRAHELVAAN
ncbi:MAG: ribonuclease 3 [Betaproteobacteria bacterium SG8_40]|nr:MAG: ribonuclease 3 [Betaproteobacteria bacterium SG8_40]